MSGSTLKYVSKLFKARVLVFGGTSGIGFSVAEAALENGASVILCSSNPSKLAGAIDRLKASYPDKTSLVSGHTADLSQPQQLESTVEAVLEAATDKGTTRIDHIVYTAGDSVAMRSLFESDVETIQKMGTVRFLGPLVVGKLASKYMSAGPASSFTLTGGTNSAKPMPGWCVQAAYGAGLEGMMRGLAVDLKPIRVNLVAPGAVHTEMYDAMPKEMLEHFLARVREQSLTGQVGRPEDVAEAYLYSMRDRFVTGTVLSSDGGRLLA